MKIFSRKNFGILFIVIGILCFIYFQVARMLYITFANFFALLGTMFIIIGTLKVYFKENIIKAHCAPLFYIIRTGFIVLMISFIVIEGLIIYNANITKETSVDYIVILGAMVRGDTPSLILDERLQAGLNCIKKHPEAKVILSGAKGPGENISEAQAMRIYLINNGVDEAKLIKEENSTNTFENLENSKKIIAKINNKTKIFIVTSDFHMFRSKMLASRIGLTAYGVPAKTELYLQPTYYLREYFAVMKSYIFDKS